MGICRAERGKYLYRIARIIQERSRELAVLETMDGGKPIRESRDVDVPLVGRAFLLLRRLGGQARVRVPGPQAARRSASPGRSSRGISRCSWPRGRSRRRSRAATRSCSSPRRRRRSRRCSSRRLFRKRNSRRASSTSSPAPGETGAAIVNHPDIDKIAFTGSTEVGKSSSASSRHRKEAHARTRRQGREHHLRRRPDRPGRRRHHQRHLFQPGPRLLRRLATVRAGEGFTTGDPEAASDRMQTLLVGDPLDKNTDIGAINSRMQLEKIKRAVAVGEDEGAELVQHAVRAARATATGSRRRFFTDVLAVASHRAGGNLRPGAGGADVPHAGGSDREGEQHAVRLERRRVDGQRLARFSR